MGPPSRRRWWAAGVVVGLVVTLLRVSVLDLLTVSSDSMEPTFCAGGIVVVTRHVDPDRIARDDVVTFDSPLDGHRTIKRVVALAGQQVGLRDARLYVDGGPVDEPWVDLRTIDGVYSETVTIPAGAVYVLGDNREFSVDSRAFGPLPTSRLAGRLLFTVRQGCRR